MSPMARKIFPPGSAGFSGRQSSPGEGHSVSLFLAGNAVLLLRYQEISAVKGVVTGKLKEHCEAIRK